MKISLKHAVLERTPAIGDLFSCPADGGVFIRISDADGARATGIPQTPSGRIYGVSLNTGIVGYFDLGGCLQIVQPVGGTLNLEYVRPN